MKQGTWIAFTAVLAALVLGWQAEASDTIWLPNIGQQVTGTIFNAHNSADVWVQGGNISLTNPSVGLNGATAPLSSTQIGFVDSSGNLVTPQLTVGGAIKTDSSATVQPVSQSGTWTTGRTWSLLNTTDSVNAVQSGAWNIGNITGTVSLPTGASTAANQATEITSLSSIDGKLTNAATTTLQTAGNGSLSSIDTKLTSQATAANQTTMNTSLSSIDGKLTGVASSANQTTGNASLSSIDSKLTNAATTTLQTTGNTSLGSIDTKLSSQATAANQATANASLASIDTKSGKNPVNTGGSHATASISSVTTLTAPANAVGFILEAYSGNSDNMRWAVGATATTTTGMTLEPGRDSGLVPIGANVSVIPVTGTQEYEIQWVIQ